MKFNRSTSKLGQGFSLPLAFALLATLLANAPAYAHDDLVSSVPAEGSQISAGVSEIRLTYSSELMQIAESAEIIVSDPSGVLINNGCAVLQGRELITSVDFEAEGTHSVSWRVVSGDGHPIEGSFSFEVSNPDGYVSNGIVPGTECDWAISDLPAAEANENASGWVYWLIWLALPIAGIGLYLWLRPRTRTRPDPSD